MTSLQKIRAENAAKARKVRMEKLKEKKLAEENVSNKESINNTTEPPILSEKETPNEDNIEKKNSTKFTTAKSEDNHSDMDTSDDESSSSSLQEKEKDIYSRKRKLSQRDYENSGLPQKRVRFDDQPRWRHILTHARQSATQAIPGSAKYFVLLFASFFLARQCTSSVTNDEKDADTKPDSDEDLLYR
jgi:hypothetical protein